MNRKSHPPPHMVEWEILDEKVKSGEYKLPIHCVVVNGGNRGVVVSQIQRTGNGVLVTCDDGKIMVTEEFPIKFKYGKDSRGTPIFIFL